MRKRILMILSAIMISTSLLAWEIIPFTTGNDNDTSPIGNNHPRSPVQAPTVYIEDYALAFVAGHPDYVLNIKDEDGVVVYSTIVTSAETLVTLPSSLSGEYVIELTMSSWIFTGWIEL